MIEFDLQIAETGRLIMNDAVAALINAHPGSVVHCEIREHNDELVRHIALTQSLEADIVLKGLDAPKNVSTLSDELHKLRQLCY